MASQETIQSVTRGVHRESSGDWSEATKVPSGVRRRAPEVMTPKSPLLSVKEKRPPTRLA